MSFLGLINDNSTNHACRATDYRPGGRTTAGHRSYRGAGADGPTAQHPLFGRAPPMAPPLNIRCSVGLMPAQPATEIISMVAATTLGAVTK